MTWLPEQSGLLQGEPEFDRTAEIIGVSEYSDLENLTAQAHPMWLAPPARWPVLHSSV